MSEVDVRSIIAAGLRQIAKLLKMFRISTLTDPQWGFGNVFANFLAEIALHFRRLVATI